MSELTEQLRSLGIRQEGDPVLRSASQPFDLPRERGGCAARFVHGVQHSVLTDVDESLDDQPTKTRFWNAFKALGPWWAEQPPY